MTGEWCRGELSINEFNDSCKNISSSYLRVGGESMSVIRFQKTVKRGLPYLSYISRKLDPLGTGFKTGAFYFTDALIFIELQMGNQGMNHSNCQQDIGATASCTKRMTEATNVIGQKSIKGGTQDFSVFDSWFASKKAA